MIQTISVSRPSYKQESVITYDESSNSASLIKKKELTIKSLSALQLLVTTLTVDQSKELSDIIGVLEETYAQVEQILGVRDVRDDFYETYSN